MKYQAKITGFGEDAFVFLDDEDSNFIIVFNDDAPAELADLCVLHEKAELKEQPAVGDTIKIGNQEYKISAVGSEAPQTLSELGHCTISFQGGSEPERPGCIMVEGPKLDPEALQASGGMIEIY